jgi:predicted porin
MNKNIKLAVAGAVLALSASAANAGIIIPAGEWTLDINGNVNAYVNQTNVDSDKNAVTGSALDMSKAGGHGSIKSIQTGLLPAWLGFTGKTRQNDLDVEFTISLQPGVSSNDITGDGATVDNADAAGTAWAAKGAGVNNQSFLNRQTYLSFGDKSWGSIKLGKDLGIYASDAILNDMTLLGVGSGGGLSSAINSTNGGIGTGYQYAAWKGQVAYTTPNFNGLQATVGITNPNQVGHAGASDMGQGSYGVEGKASYSFNANDVAGKIWASGATYQVNATRANNTNVYAVDIGANINVGGLGLTGYYYSGKGNGITFFGTAGLDATGQRRDGDGGYLQATYVLPTKTKIGAAWGRSTLDLAGGADTGTGTGVNAVVKDQTRWTVGAYHPLTKHLNLVAELSEIKLESHAAARNEYTNASLGAIMFF